jgi:hypothetical protein
MSVTRAPDRRDPADSRHYPSLSQLGGVVDYAASKNVTISENFALRAVKAKQLPYSIICGKRAFAPADVDEWLLSLRRNPAAEQVSA